MRKTALLALLGAILPAAGDALAGSFTTGGGDASFRRIEASGGKLTGVDLTGSFVLQKGVAISLAQIAAEAAVAAANGTPSGGGTGASNLGQPNGPAQLDAAGTLSSNTVTIGNNHVTLATIGGLAENAMPAALLGAANGVATLDANASLSAGTAAATWASAVQRPLGARFADSLNVKDFGAVGDGATDSTAAFAAAIGLATGIDLGATIDIPQGHYILRQTLVAQLVGDTGVHIRGAGVGETMLEFQIPAASPNQDGIDIVGAPNTCVPSCFNWNSPWRGGGLSGGAQGQSSTIDDLTLKTTGGPGYPAGSMISAQTAYSQAAEGQLPWLTIRNIDGMGAGPNSAPIWLNGIKLVAVQNVAIRNVYLDGHSQRSAGMIGTTQSGSFIAGAGLLVAASPSSSQQSYLNQTQGLMADTINVSGFQAAVALGGEAQGNMANNLNCASGGGNYNCVVMGGGVIFDGDSGADFAVPSFINANDYRVWVQSTSGIRPGMQIVPVTGSTAGALPQGTVVDTVGTTATNGFYPVSWTSPLEATTTAIAADTCSFTPASGSAVSQTCSAAANSDVLTVGSTTGMQPGTIVADRTNPASFPTTMQIWAILSGTTLEVRASPSATGDETPAAFGSASAPSSLVFAPATAFVANVPFGTGGFSVHGFDCGGPSACLYAPASPFEGEGGFPQITITDGSIQSTASPQFVIGGGSNHTISNVLWNYGSGVFAQVSNATGVIISGNVINGNSTNTSAIVLNGVSASAVYDNINYGTSPLGTDSGSGNLWGLNFYAGAAHLGLAGTPVSLDSPLSGCLGTNGGAAWSCAVSGTVAAGSTALLTPMGALPLPGTTTAGAAAATGATTLAVATSAPFAAGMTLSDATTGAAATVRSVSGTTLTFYPPGLSGAVASGDTLGNGYPAMGEVGGGLVPGDGSLWAQGACNDATRSNRTLLALGQQYAGPAGALGTNANSFTTVYASTSAGALFPGLAVASYPSGLPLPGIAVTNSNGGGGAPISCGFEVSLLRAP